MVTQRNPDEIRKEILGLVSEYYHAKFPKQIFVPGQSRIDPGGKDFDDRELRNGVEAILDAWWTEGRFAKEFQKKFGEYLGINNVVITNSGSSASLLAFSALTSPALKDRAIQRGDEVIGVAAAFPTTVSPVVQYKCVPVFVDIENIESGQYNIDPSKLEAAVSEKTKAIFLAHTLGNPFNIEKVSEVAKKHNLWVIEDCCDALGSTYDGKKVSHFGDLGIFSFYPAHQITMGEGGAIVTNNAQLKNIVLSFRNWGRDCWCDTGVDNTCGRRFSWSFEGMPPGYDHKNTYTHQGFNLKSTDQDIAIGLAQLEKLDTFVAKRRENFAYLSQRLSKYQDEIILPQKLPKADPSWFGFLITVRPGASFSRDEFVEYLTYRKVNTRPLFAGNLSKQPSFRNVEYRIFDGLENTDYAMNNTFWIGVQPNITEDKREYMADAIDGFFDGHSAKER